MSWLYSMVFAGLMLSTDGNALKPSNYNYITPEIKTTVKADETERFEQTYPLNADGKVSVSNVNGSITVDTWDNPQVKLEWVKTADAKENLGEVEIKIDARQESMSVQTNYLDWKRPGASGRTYNKLTVEYHLIVPRNAVLDEIETVNGSVNITNAENTTKASAVNGGIKAVNLHGTANLSTVNGTIAANFDQLQSGSRINLETVNGTVYLTIPSDASATLKAETVNGNISNDFGLPVRKGQYVGRDMYAKLGGGDISIKLESVNGGLSVKHKNDGKTLSPVTNLLSPKSKSDEDWDNDDDEDYSGVKPPKPPKTPKMPPNAPPPPPTPVGFDSANLDAKTRREVEQAMKDAQKEIENQIKAGINSKEIQAQLKAAQDQYKQAMEQMANAKWNYDSPSIEEKNGSFAVKGTPKVTVETKAFDVIVRGWDKPEVSYSVVRITRSNGKPINEEWTISATQNNDSDISFEISSESKSGNVVFDDATKGRIEIFVPKKSNLKITTGGEIRLESVSGKIDLKGDDEAINVRDGDGQLTLASEDARVRIIGFKGDVAAKNADGTMNFEGDFHSLSAETVDGTIVLTLPENANANIESNGKDTIGEGFTPNYKDDGKSNFVWKVGSGGNKHRLFSTDDGKIIVRNANTLTAVQ